VKRRYVVFVIAFAASMLFGIQPVFVNANPYTFPTATTPPDSVHLTLMIASPKDNAEYSNGTINVHFNETIDGPSSISKSLHIVSTYQGDWMNNSKWCPFPPGVDRFKGQYSFLQNEFNLTDIPVGEHTLNITAQGQGGFNENNTQYSFVFQKTASIKFTIANSNQPTTTLIPTEGSSVPTQFSSSSSNQRLVPDFCISLLVLGTAAFAIIVTAAVLLVYFKRREKP
jgi:hypothetical protein